MAQVLEFKLPDLGEGLTEAEIVRWLVEVGDVVAIDQPVVEVETAKAMVEVPCPYGGVVTARFGEEGTELPVGAPLLTVAVGAPSPDASGEDSEGSGNVLVGYGTSEAPARRRRVRPAAPNAGTNGAPSGGTHTGPSAAPNGAPRAARAFPSELPLAPASPTSRARAAAERHVLDAGG
ncbi:biotin/lipoyl-containing protein, partial [Streptomyces nigra]